MTPSEAPGSKTSASSMRPPGTRGNSTPFPRNVRFPLPWPSPPSRSAWGSIERPRQALEHLAGLQMVDVKLPPTDGRQLTLSRCKQPDPPPNCCSRVWARDCPGNHHRGFRARQQWRFPKGRRSEDLGPATLKKPRKSGVVPKNNGSVSKVRLRPKRTIPPPGQSGGLTDVPAGSGAADPTPGDRPPVTLAWGLVGAGTGHPTLAAVRGERLGTRQPPQAVVFFARGAACASPHPRSRRGTSG